MDVYTPCGSEHGISEAASNTRARLAVESRVHPLFVHDPRRGRTLHDRFSLEGNPDPDKTWTASTIEHVDAEGNLQLLETPLTPAEFALGEVRFAKQFRRVRPDEEARTVPIHEFVELDTAARGELLPFVYATDEDKRLIKVACAEEIVHLVEDRKRYWQMLQYLSGQHEAELTAQHRAELNDLRSAYEQAANARESSLDDIARTMADLAMASKAPAAATGLTGPAFVGTAEIAAPTQSPGQTSTTGAQQAETSPDQRDHGPVWIDPAEQTLCNDCGTCYQELPQFFVRSAEVVDGKARVLAKIIPGSTDNVEITPELAKRIERVKATCDAEIIR